MPRGKQTTTTKRKATARKARAKKPAGLPVCEVQGCDNPGLEQHDGPNGKVTLCGRCGELARASLRDAERRAEILDIAASPFEKSMVRQQQRRDERDQKRVRAVLLG